MSIDFRGDVVTRDPRVPRPAPEPPTPEPPPEPPQPTPPPTPTPAPPPAPPAPPTVPTPTTPQTTSPYRSALEGFDAAKFDDPTHQTIKYQFARIAAKYPPTQAGFAQLVADPEFQKLGLQSVGNGNIRMPDGSTVDVVRAYGAGGQAWQWGQTTGPGGAALPGATTPVQTGTQGSTGYTYDPASGLYSTGGQSYYYNSGTGQFYPTGGAAGYVPGAGVTPPGYPEGWQIPGTVNNPTNEFSDPTTAAFEKLLNARITELAQPNEDKSRTQYASLLQQNVEDLSKTPASLENLIAQLEAQAKSYQQPSQYEQTLQAQLPGLSTPSGFETMGAQLAQQFQSLPPEYAQQAKDRIAQLQAEPYTGAEWELYRTAALDPIESDRQAAHARIMGEISRRGIDPSSGIAQQMLLEADRGFDANRANAQNSLGQSRVAVRDARQGQAFDIEQALQALTQGRQEKGVGVQQNVSEAERARLMQALGISQELTTTKDQRGDRSAQLFGTLADIPQARAQQQLTAADALSQLSSQVRAEEQARRSESLALSGQVYELPQRSLQMALATLGQGEAPGSIMNSLTSLAGLANQRQATTANQQNGLWSGLGGLLAYLSQTQGSGSGTSGNTGPLTWTQG